jgi:hypothetical protein
MRIAHKTACTWIPKCTSTYLVTGLFLFISYLCSDLLLRLMKDNRLFFVGVPSRWCVCSLAGKRVLSLIGRWILCIVVCPFARFWGLASLGRFTKYKSSLCSKPCLMTDTSISIHINSLCHFSCFPFWTYKGVYNILCCIFVLLSWTGPFTLLSPTSLFKICLCPTSRGTGHVKNYLIVSLFWVLS